MIVHSMVLNMIKSWPIDGIMLVDDIRATMADEHGLCGFMPRLMMVATMTFRR